MNLFVQWSPWLPVSLRLPVHHGPYQGDPDHPWGGEHRPGAHRRAHAGHHEDAQLLYGHWRHAEVPHHVCHPQSRGGCSVIVLVSAFACVLLICMFAHTVGRRWHAHGASRLAGSLHCSRTRVKCNHRHRGEEGPPHYQLYRGGRHEGKQTECIEGCPRTGE